jgi:flagellin FlaB
MFERDEERGQVGIGTLIVFIAMVLVAAIAAGVLINTAGFLQSKSEQTGEQSSQQVTNRLDTVTVTGQVGNEEVTDVNLTVKKAPGADDINLQNVTLQWTGPNGATTLTDIVTYANSTSANQFRNVSIKDADDSRPVINSPDDRIDIGLDLDGDDTAANPGDPADTITPDIDPLQEGETATLTLTTQSGGSTEVRIEVPPSLSGETAVEL